MVSSRTATAVVGVLASLAISVAARVHFDTLLVFLVVPFVPLLLRGQAAEPQPVKRCPVCGLETREPTFTHCPHDGTALE